jgi:hypothetical protein
MALSKSVFVSAAMAAIILSSCDVTKIAKITNTPLHAGMTSKAVLRAYGAPLKVEPQSDGSADWIYSFATGFTESGFSAEFDDCGEYWAGPYDSVGVGFEKKAIRIAPDGRVMGEIPEGRVVRK